MHIKLDFLAKSHSKPKDVYGKKERSYIMASITLTDSKALEKFKITVCEDATFITVKNHDETMREMVFVQESEQKHDITETDGVCTIKLNRNETFYVISYEKLVDIGGNRFKCCYVTNNKFYEIVDMTMQEDLLVAFHAFNDVLKNKGYTGYPNI